MERNQSMKQHKCENAARNETLPVVTGWNVQSQKIVGENTVLWATESNWYFFGVRFVFYPADQSINSFQQSLWKIIGSRLYFYSIPEKDCRNPSVDEFSLLGNCGTHGSCSNTMIGVLQQHSDRCVQTAFGKWRGKAWKQTCTHVISDKCTLWVFALIFYTDCECEKQTRKWKNLERKRVGIIMGDITRLLGIGKYTIVLGYMERHSNACFSMHIPLWRSLRHRWHRWVRLRPMRWTS